MSALWILVLLIIISAVFSLAEMAFASAKRARLVQMAAAGNKRAEIAILIRDNPSKLLAATQTGITAAALLMGIYGESGMSSALIAFVPESWPISNEWRENIAFTLTIIIVTATSIIFGEIIPK